MTGATDPFIGRILNDRFRAVTSVGKGAMSTIYRGEPVKDGEPVPDAPPVAIKVLHDHLLQREGQRERFEREARALFGLAHPHILRVEDHGVIDNVPFLVTELLEGKTLDAYIQAGLPSPEEGLELARQILSGLAFAHDQGVIHRDLKTENIFVTTDADGKPLAKLLDFGLVKFVDDGKWGFEHQLTATGDVFGSPAYMSPEQALGAPLDARSDVYSMGVVLFELFTGRWPFMEESQAAMMHAHVSLPPSTLASVRPETTYPLGLEAMFTKALAKQKEHRFENAGAMLAAMERVAQGLVEPPPPVASAVSDSLGGNTTGSHGARTQNEAAAFRPRPAWLPPTPQLLIAAAASAAVGVVLAVLVGLVLR